MTREQLLLRAKVYFDHNEDLKEMHASDDGHFFYQEGQVIQYCKGKIQHSRITREEVYAKKSSKTEKQRLQEKAKEMEIEGWETLSVAKLKEEINSIEFALAKRKKLEEEAMILNLEGFEDKSDEELEELIDTTKADAKAEMESNETKKKLVEEATELELMYDVDISNEDLEKLIEDKKDANKLLADKLVRKEELEAIGDKRTDDEDEELENLIAELKETK